MTLWLIAVAVFTTEAQRTLRNSLILPVLGVSAVSETFIISLTNTKFVIFVVFERFVMKLSGRLDLGYK